jgi:subtilisin family serine protease
MNASAARSTYSGEGLSVAICDTGIDYNHVALGNGGFPNSKVIGGYDTGDDDNDPMDMQGHGTACAGISAGNLGNQGDYIGGVAWGARLYALKISHGSGGSAYLSNMIEAWEWCISHQYDDPNHPILVINTSFGAGRYTETCDADSPAMTKAAANAKAAGMTLFVSSGNDGYCDAIGWPACISHVISVGAVYDAHFTAESIGWCVQQQSCAVKNPTWGCSSRILLAGCAV